MRLEAEQSGAGGSAGRAGYGDHAWFYQEFQANTGKRWKKGAKMLSVLNTKRCLTSLRPTIK